jgi:hypothetical protein
MPDLKDYVTIGTCAIALGLGGYIFNKFLEKRRERRVPEIVRNNAENIERHYVTTLKNQLDTDWKALSKFPKGHYVTLSPEEQRVIDEFRKPLLLMKEKYSDNSLDHLWGRIPEGHEKNVLRAKQAKLKKKLDDLISSLPKDFKQY